LQENVPLIAIVTIKVPVGDGESRNNLTSRIKSASTGCDSDISSFYGCMSWCMSTENSPISRPIHTAFA